MLDNPIYIQDLQRCIKENIPWEQLDGRKILITGASGLIGSFLVDLFMYRNRVCGSKISVCAMGRNFHTGQIRFKPYLGDKYFTFFEHDVTEALADLPKCDYIIHAASNAQPHVLASDPVGTMQGNYLGMYNLLEFARLNGTLKTLFVSSGEVYGVSYEDGKAFDENFSGEINSVNPRSSYPISKLAAETLCAGYFAQYGVNTVIARPCYIYGPTRMETDTRVTAQFIKNSLLGQNILMKSLGTPVRTYCYVSDCVVAILAILLCGVPGEAYNIADKLSQVSIKEMAQMLADIANVEVQIELPPDFSPTPSGNIMRTVLNAEKVEKLGWSAKVHMREGLERTVEILKATQS